MVQWLRAFAALVDDPGSIPSTNMVSIITCNPNPRGSDALPLASQALSSHMKHTSYLHTIYSYIKIKSLKEEFVSA